MVIFLFRSSEGLLLAREARETKRGHEAIDANQPTLLREAKGLTPPPFVVRCPSCQTCAACRRRGVVKKIRGALRRGAGVSAPSEPLAVAGTAGIHSGAGWHSGQKLKMTGAENSADSLLLRAVYQSVRGLAQPLRGLSANLNLAGVRALPIPVLPRPVYFYLPRRAYRTQSGTRLWSIEQEGNDTTVDRNASHPPASFVRLEAKPRRQPRPGGARGAADASGGKLSGSERASERAGPSRA
jgi:hypothetical protein